MKKIFAPLLLVATLTSCEKVIDLDLNDNDPRYVIEAIVTDQPNGAGVIITQTKNFDEDNNYPGVAGAVVQVTEDGGPTYAFAPTGITGNYTSPGFVATAGKRYLLNVTIGTETFTASCTMPQRVNFDSLFVTDEFLFTDTRKIANTTFTDPEGKGNAYRFIQYLNDIKEKQIFIQNDDYSDGRNINNKLFYFADDDEEETLIRSGDNLRVDMLCIDPVIYKYWFSLFRSSTGESGQATPANPVSNIEGGALGYFSVHSIQTRRIVVP